MMNCEVQEGWRRWKYGGEAPVWTESRAWSHLEDRHVALRLRKAGPGGRNIHGSNLNFYQHY